MRYYTMRDCFHEGHLYKAGDIVVVEDEEKVLPSHFAPMEGKGSKADAGRAAAIEQIQKELLILRSQKAPGAAIKLKIADLAKKLSDLGAREIMAEAPAPKPPKMRVER